MLKLRPANAVARWGPRSRLPLLNPVHLARALEEARCPLLCIQTPAVEVIPGLLRAARDGDAVLGIACPQPPPSGKAEPDRFAAAVAEYTDELDHRRPLFLQAGPIPVPSEGGLALERTLGDVHRYLDAGFSLVSLDPSFLAVEAGAAAVAQLSAPLRERELALEVVVSEAARALPLLGELARHGSSPAFIRVPMNEVSEALAEAAAARGAMLSVEGSEAPEALLAAAGARAVRKVEVFAPFAGPLLDALPPKARDEARSRGGGGARPSVAVFSHRRDWLTGVEEPVRDRLEARCYAATDELLRTLGALGSSRQALDGLAARRGA